MQKLQYNKDEKFHTILMYNYHFKTSTLLLLLLHGKLLRLADVVHSNPTEKNFQFCHNIMLSCSFPRLVTTARVAVAGYVNLPILRLNEMSAIGLLVNISFG